MLRGIPLQRALLKACRLDVVAFKPGNVSLCSAGHGMTADDFLLSARAAVPALCVEGRAVGERIRCAIDAAREAVDCNTNLGIVLLLAPLAAASELDRPAGLEGRLGLVLDRLTVADSAACFQAIRRAQPAGLGRAEMEDVTQAPQLGLREVMALAAARDAIALQYTTTFATVLSQGRSWLAHYRQRWHSLAWATTACYLHLLAEMPDSHVARKFGMARATALSMRVRTVVSAVKACENPRLLVDQLTALDHELKTGGINPGTSADLTVASVAALLLER